VTEELDVHNTIGGTVEAAVQAGIVHGGIYVHSGRPPVIPLPSRPGATVTICMPLGLPRA
jgi:hypothetical protein